MPARRLCEGECGRNRAEKFFVSERGRICTTCQTKKRKATARDNHRLRTYGLSPEQYSTLLAAQGGRCAICKGERNYELHVDHDHRSGLVRGLLCKRCNKLLGKIEDDVRILRSAADYIDLPPAAVVGIEAKAA